MQLSHCTLPFLFLPPGEGVSSGVPASAQVALQAPTRYPVAAPKASKRRSVEASTGVCGMDARASPRVTRCLLAAKMKLTIPSYRSSIGHDKSGRHF
jgi:hypothetical protein